MIIHFDFLNSLSFVKLFCEFTNFPNFQTILIQKVMKVFIEAYENCLYNQISNKTFKTCLFLIYVRTIKSRMGDREIY